MSNRTFPASPLCDSGRVVTLIGCALTRLTSLREASPPSQRRTLSRGSFGGRARIARTEFLRALVNLLAPTSNADGTSAKCMGLPRCQTSGTPLVSLMGSRAKRRPRTPLINAGPVCFRSFRRAAGQARMIYARKCEEPTSWLQIKSKQGKTSFDACHRCKTCGLEIVRKKVPLHLCPKAKICSKPLTLAERTKLWKQWRQEASLESGCLKALRKARDAAKAAKGVKLGCHKTLRKARDVAKATSTKGGTKLGGLRMKPAARQSC